jgi:hypothetical protein
MKRVQMSAQERSWRSDLAQLVSHRSFLRGYLSVRERSCGKPTCHCAQGEKHRSLYLVCSQEGKPRQLFIPREQEEEVRQWVAQYQRLRELLERISESAWERLRRKEP